MPAATARAAPAGRRDRTRLPSAGQPSIQSFAKTLKPGLSLDKDKKDTPGKPFAHSSLTPSPSKKRKRATVDADAHDDVDCSLPAATEPVAVQDTPSRTLKFGSLSVSTPRPADGEAASVTESKSVCEPAKQTDRPRPAGVNELLALNRAFLSALSLHMAHNGPTTPADLRELLPGIEKIWKKRKVVVRDLQRLTRVWNDASDCLGMQFRIVNYGLGRVCLERMVSSEGDKASKIGGRFDENELQRKFARELEDRWRKCVSEGCEDKFVDLLGLAPIIDSLVPLPGLRKGQQRLQDLKGCVIKAKTAMLKTKSSDVNEPKNREPTADRQKNLLERIRNKELHQASLPPPPTEKDLLRQSAAERVEDVTRVLLLLRPQASVKNGVVTAQKKPYQFEALVQNIQDSLRRPGSSQEIAACLDILAQKDVAGDWVDIVKIDKLTSVVLKSGSDISPEEISARVNRGGLVKA